MRLRLSALLERLTTSLFFVPMLAVVAATGLGLVTIQLDRQIEQPNSLPLGLTSTVDSARAVLSTIAAATITFAGIAFSVSLLLIQQAATQYSPRVVHTLFRDPYNRRVMALVVGTFTYCVVVLRSVRSAVEQSGQPVIPNVSLALAVVLGIATILAIVAFINHSAHTMDISEILEDVRTHAIRQLRVAWTETERGADLADCAGIDPPLGRAWTGRFDRSGWVQSLDVDAMLELTPSGATTIVSTYPGRYAVEGATLCAMSAEPDDPEATTQAVNEALTIGRTRTMQQDVSYGIRQLADVAVKALSPGINDPTTAQDAIFHLAAVLGEALRREPPTRVHVGDGGRRVLLVEQPGHEDLIDLAFDEIRRAATPHPTVVVYLLEALAVLCDIARAAGADARTGALERQARLIVDASGRSAVVDEDRELVRSAYEQRFGGPA